MSRTRSSIRSASRASARSAWSAPRPQSPTRSITRPANACAICRSRWINCVDDAWLIPPFGTRILPPSTDAACRAGCQRPLRSEPSILDAMTRRNVFGLLLSAAAALPAVASAQPADRYPVRPVQIIIPAAAGNSPHVAARVVADRLTQLWKQQVIIINRPGAGGLLAAQAASTADKSGHTLYMTQASTYTVLPVP